MTKPSNNLNTEIRGWQDKLLSRSVRRNNKCSRIISLVGKTMDLQCLEISMGDGAISANLRALGGSWKTAVPSQSAADSISYSVADPIVVLENGKLPFADNTFNRLVIVDALKAFADDYEFVHECHRVLKNDAWVIISETRRAPFSTVAFLQRIFGLLPVSNGEARNGYKIIELFNILRDGFDVPETIVYSNSLLETAATIGEAFQKMITHGHYWLVRESAGSADLGSYKRLYGLAGFMYPLLWTLSQFDFLPGHKLLVKSKRRHWSPRIQPVLRDGRSIAEAAINTKIGTAAPF